NQLNLGLDQLVSHQRLHISISANYRRKLLRQREIILTLDFSVVTLCNLSLTVSTNVRPHVFPIPSAMVKRAPADLRNPFFNCDGASWSRFFDPANHRKRRTVAKRDRAYFSGIRSVFELWADGIGKVGLKP